MIFLFVLIFGVLFLFFNIRQIAPGNKGSIVAGIIVALLPICFIFREHLWASIGQAFLAVWLCEALLIYLLWCVVCVILRFIFRKSFSKRCLVIAARILFALTIVVSTAICIGGSFKNADYVIRTADIVLVKPSMKFETALVQDSLRGKQSSKKLHTPYSFTILFFSDIHITPLFDRMKLERMIYDANRIRPDYIVFGGDFADVHDSILIRDGYDTLVMQLGSMAKRNAFAVNGNHEGYLERNGSDFNNFLRHIGWVPLDDSTACDSLVCFTGRTDYQVARSRDIPRKNLSNLIPITISQDSSTLSSISWIIVDHEPKGIEPNDYSRLPDLALSGHTHNGQFFPGTIIINWVWPLAHGLGEIDGVKWLVSSGIGSWGPPVRFGSETEMWLIKVTISDNR